MASEYDQSVIEILRGLTVKLHIKGSKNQRKRIQQHFNSFNHEEHITKEMLDVAVEAHPDNPAECAQYALGLCYQNALPEATELKQVELRTNTLIEF